MVQQVCERKVMKPYLFSIFCICGTLFCMESVGKSKTKVLPSYLQKAYVIQRDAIVYSRSDFDSIQITTIPAGAKVTISKKIYRPKTRFGTFYRIYIKKPKKIRAYISEIDVVPRYIRSGSQLKLNPGFNQVKKKLKQIKDFQFNAEQGDVSDLSDKDLFQMRFIGMAVAYSWLAYESKSEFVPTWLFGLKFNGPGLPIKNVFTDTSLMFSVSPPVIGKKVLKRGYLLIGDFLFKLPLVTAPGFLFQLGAGVMIKLKGALSPEDPARSEVGAGVAGSGTFILKLHDRLSFSMEGKAYYDLRESKFAPGMVGGLLVTF